MSSYKPKPIDEDSRSSEGIGEEELDEEGFFSYREEETSSIHHQTWSPFEDLDDSGHFTASPDGETALSGSSRSQSPCPVTVKMQQSDDNANNTFPKQNKILPQPLQASKPLNAPRSVMTVKVPQPSNINAINSFISPTLHETPQLSSVNCPTPHTRFQDPSQSSSSTSVFHDSENGDSSEDSPGYLRGILENFSSLYMEKLKMLDGLLQEGNEEHKMLLMEKKATLLERWAKDVCVQNMVLVHTVEELEREANNKIVALQKKITESTQAAKEHMTMIKKYEEQVKLLLKNHSDTEEKNLVLKIDLEKLRNECRRVKDRMDFMLKDNESLITLVCRIRDMGVWDVNGLDLTRSTFEQIFGLYPNLMGCEVQAVFSKEKARRAQDAEEKVSQLEKKLANLQQTHREAELQMSVKDSKIEELETEIKNISNRAQYCEQECNEYKRSLLETQEKLLEATRRLNSEPKYKKPAISTNEITELIKELRDVKSQLNTAVEEKVTAKEESNFFKRELGERLREIHEIQTVFHNLATEVTSSRAAFQQVQEKEVQLQLLRSEVQTYQSRCTDAEDTIRKKEKEIKLLQKQMNEIHKRSKKPSNPASTNSMQEGTTVTSEKVPGPILNFYQANLRNVSTPTKIPVRKAAVGKAQVPRHRSEGPIGSNNRNKIIQKDTGQLKQRRNSQTVQARPLWNTHFKKSSRPFSRPPPVVLPKVSSNPAGSQASFKRSSQHEETDEGIDVISQNCKVVLNRLSEIEQKLSEQALCSSLDIENRNNSVLESAPPSEKFTSSFFKLPNIREKIGEEYLQSQLKKPTLPFEPPAVAETVLEKEKFPPVKNESCGKKVPNKRFQNPLMKTLNKINPLESTPRLNELITAVVETSKQLLGTEADEPFSKNKGIQSLTITASRYNNRKQKPVKKQKTMEARRVKSSDKNAETNRGTSAEEPPPIMPTKFHSSTGISHDFEEPKIIYEPPENDQEFLAGLPRASQDDLVTTWIKKSKSSPNANKNEKVQKKSNKPKTPVVSGRRPSVKVMKHLATRRWPKSKEESEKQTEDLNTQMFELEDEWGQVFANLECSVDVDNSPKSVPRKEKVVKSIDTAYLVERFASPGVLYNLGSSSSISEPAFEINDGPANNSDVSSFPTHLYPQDGCCCDCCENRRQISDLTNRFENRKSFMLSELGNLKAYSSQLDQDASLLSSQIQTVKELVTLYTVPAMADAKESPPEKGVTSHSVASKEHLQSQRNEWPAVSSLEDSIDSANSNSTNLAAVDHDVELLKKMSSTVFMRLRNQFKDIQMSFDHNAENIGRARRNQDINHEGHLSTTGSETNHLMVAQIKSLEKLESGLSADSFVQNESSSGDIANKVGESSQVASHYTPLQKLETMKKAFDTNQDIIVAQERKLVKTLEMISKYEQFVQEIWSFAGSVIPFSENENARQDLTLKLEHLCECVKQALVDNGVMCKKLDSLQQVLLAANREKALLSETVTSLNNHIDALSQQNDKLLHQFDKGNQQKRCKNPLLVSNLSSPRSDISERVENESSSFVVDAGASGDRSCQMNAFFASSSVAPIPLQDDVGNEDVHHHHRYPFTSTPCIHHEQQQHCSRKSNSQMMTLSSVVEAAEAYYESTTIGNGQNPAADADANDVQTEQRNVEKYMRNLKLMTKCLQELEKSTTTGKGVTSCSFNAMSPTNSSNFDINDFGSGVTSGGIDDAFVRENPQDSKSPVPAAAAPTKTPLLAYYL